tara:strand:+ start:179 stop:556 length:378 start_codon:yes stop_codon:yes gene_type:complete
MSFQWIIDDAASISINRKDTVANTVSRDGTVRAVKRGDAKKVFTVALPDGPRWSDLKDDIVAAEALDRYTEVSISIPYASFPWYYGNVQPGTDETYTVICIDFPEWTIFARDQVSWSGPFIFVEV